MDTKKKILWIDDDGGKIHTFCEKLPFGFDFVFLNQPDLLRSYLKYVRPNILLIAIELLLFQGVEDFEIEGAKKAAGLSLVENFFQGQYREVPVIFLASQPIGDTEVQRVQKLVSKKKVISLFQKNESEWNEELAKTVVSHFGFRGS